ncbi:MAG: ABC-F family ATP-binding cassette domain-containing protein [Proteobacteria bacterium]|nr:ABC-F family ATP-binding cassette domain-containing protein [Pseudomonadota bacterium]
MISVNNLGIHFGTQTLFSDVNFQLNPGNNYGLVGANGSGKSTLMKMLIGTVLPEKGEIVIPNNLKLGVLQQDHFSYENHSILDVVLMGNKLLWSAIEEKNRLLQSDQIDDDIGHRLGELEIAIADQDGYQAEADVAEMLVGLGINLEQHYQKLSTLSGGYKLRILLAQCLFSDPDVLFLDEPTNHLDLGSISWLEGYIKNFRGTSLVISHDHHFLDQICTHIMDIDYETVRIYPGNYQQFLDRKELERTQKEIEITKQEKKKDEIQQFVDRFKAKATKARQASSKAKQLNKMEEIVIKRSSRISPNFLFPIKRPSGKTALTLTGLNKNFGTNEVLKNLSFTLNRSSKLAVIGPNGIGKSTLLKILAGEQQPTTGIFEWGHEVSAGYFSQDHHDLIPAKTTAYEWLYSFSPSEEIGTIRGLLARVLLTQDDVHKATQNLSGGEAGRLIFAKLMLEKGNLLLLDEPTNHMDLETIGALSKAIVNYEGTIMCVSHDRHFIESFATDILELKSDGFELFHGNYHQYMEKVGRDYLDRNGDQNIGVKKKKKKKKKNTSKAGQNHASGKERSKLEKKADSKEKRIAKTEEQITRLEAVLAENYLYQAENRKVLDQKLTEKKDLESFLEQLMAEWESIQKKMELFTQT